MPALRSRDVAKKPMGVKKVKRRIEVTNISKLLRDTHEQKVNYIPRLIIEGLVNICIGTGDKGGFERYRVENGD